ncbi:hypothetical protein PG984_007048 [Apiospora sp. TS-2023a]
MDACCNTSTNDVGVCAAPREARRSSGRQIAAATLAYEKMNFRPVLSSTAWSCASSAGSGARLRDLHHLQPQRHFPLEIDGHDDFIGEGVPVVLFAAPQGILGALAAENRSAAVLSAACVGGARTIKPAACRLVNISLLSSSSSCIAQLRQKNTLGTMRTLRWAVLVLLLPYAQVALGSIASKTLQDNTATITARAVSTTQSTATRDPRLCGYITGNAARPFMCDPGKICRSNDEFSVAGCVSTVDGFAVSSIITACRGYDVYTEGGCDNLPTRVGCCANPSYPICINMKYTALASRENFNVYRCGKPGYAGNLLAWDASTTAPGDTTTTVGPEISIITAAATPDENGLSRADKIALGCGIGIGLPATIAGIISCIIAVRRRR